MIRHRIPIVLLMMLWTTSAMGRPIEVPPQGSREVAGRTGLSLKTTISDLPDGVLTGFRLGGSFKLDIFWIGAMWDFYQFASHYTYNETDPDSERLPESLNGLWDLHLATGVAVAHGDWGAVAALFKVEMPTNSLTMWDRAWVLEPGFGFDVGTSWLLFSGDVTLAWSLREEKKDSLTFLGRIQPGVSIAKVVEIYCGVETNVGVWGLDSGEYPRVFFVPALVGVLTKSGLEIEGAFRFAITGDTPPELGLYLPPDWSVMVGLSQQFK